MPFIILGGILAGAFIIYLGVSFAAAHLLATLIVLVTSVSAIGAAFTAVSRGADKRDARRWVPPAVKAAPRKPQLPPVAASYTWQEPPPPPPPGNFSSGDRYEEDAEPVVLISSEPAAMCEGPACGQELPEDPWQCGTAGGLAGEGEDVHSFCGRPCLDSWLAAREAAHAHGAGRR
jgi:hypothetical protein